MASNTCRNLEEIFLSAHWLASAGGGEEGQATQGAQGSGGREAAQWPSPRL